MRFVLLSDVHLSWDNPGSRLDDVRLVQLEKLREVFQWAEKHSAVILQAGDFFDRPRSWYLLPEVMKIFQEFDNRFIGVYGQHDTYMYSEGTRESTNLGILMRAGLIDIVGPSSREWIDIGDSVIVGCSFGQNLDENELKKLPDKTRILIIHASISSEGLYPGQEYTLARRFLRENKLFDLILCGDIHRFFIEKEKERFIVNTGPLVRRTAEEYNFTHEPCFILYDPEEGILEKKIISHLPSKRVLTREHIERKTEAEEKLSEFIGMVKEDELQSVSFEENLQIFLRNNKVDLSVVNILSEVMSEER